MFTFNLFNKNNQEFNDVATATAPSEDVATATAPSEDVATATAPSEDVATDTAPSEDVATDTAPSADVPTATDKNGKVYVYGSTEYIALLKEVQKEERKKYKDDSYSPLKFKGRTEKDVQDVVAKWKKWKTDKKSLSGCLRVCYKFLKSKDIEDKDFQDTIRALSCYDRLKKAANRDQFVAILTNYMNNDLHPSQYNKDGEIAAQFAVSEKIGDKYYNKIVKGERIFTYIKLESWSVESLIDFLLEDRKRKDCDKFKAATAPSEDVATDTAPSADVPSADVATDTAPSADVPSADVV